MSQRVVLGISGGVDSAVAALLLKKQGYEVLPVFMNNWEEKDEDGVCSSDEDFALVRRVCEQLNLPYYSINFAKEYYDRVFSYFLEEYKAGRTPNPDVLCNKEIKFKAFLDFALEMGADRLATGHYARRIERDGLYLLAKSADAGKDQTYFLHPLGQKEMSRAMFPIGEMQKAEVRALAREAGLANSERKDSTGICFIGERNFRKFLSQYLPAAPGDMRSIDTGEVIGRHDGLMYYTLGQRKGLGIGGKGDGRAWFVVGKDLSTRTLWIAQGNDHPLLYSKECRVSHLSWVTGEAPGSSFACTAKFRYRQPDQQVHVEVSDDEVLVRSAVPQRAVTPGQFAVFYEGDICLGGGVIEKVFSGD